MTISILTLFPEMFAGPFDYSIIKRAKEKGLVEINFINIRDFGIGLHQMVDDTAYGGGVGMVMRVDVVHDAIKFAKHSFSKNVILSNSEESHKKNRKDPSAKPQDDKSIKEKVVHLTASGKQFNQTNAQAFSELNHLILICGHYEGIDDRIKHYIDEELAIGDFVLTGGEIPAMLIADAVTRLLPGVLPVGATEDESFSKIDNQTNNKLLEYPHYTKPPVYDGHEVPEVLLSGNHKKIDEWRTEQAIEKTRRIRPDLLEEK